MYSNELICNILDYLNNNINKEITTDELSSIFHYDKTYIMKKFKKELNLSIHEYINTIRILNSLPYFKNNKLFLNIAFKNGFNSLEYFSEIFKKMLGVSPNIYKRFINYKNISDNNLDNIINNLSRINTIKLNITNYLNHRKPTYTSYVKKLEI